MDKTDYCVSNYLTGKDGKPTDDAKKRNRRLTIDGAPMFPKLEKPRETKWTSRGGGMTHDGKRGLSRIAYERKRVAHCVRRVDDNVGEIRLIRAEDMPPRAPNTAKPSKARHARA